MIAIFHNFPEIDELKKNFLFFDELQTSYSFFQNNLNLLKVLSNSDNIEEWTNTYQHALEKLFEKEIIKTKEDIETRIIPDVGGFNNESINVYLKNINLNESLRKFYSRILEIKSKFGIQIVGDNLKLSLSPSIEDPRNLLAMNSQILLRKNSGGNVLSYVNDFSSLYSRFAVMVLNDHYNDNNYFPLVGETLTSLKNNIYDFSEKMELESLKARTVNLVINKFPHPDPKVSWDQLIKFKTDPDSRRKRLALKNWITEFSHKGYTLSEISDKLEYLLEEYAAHMKYHKIKFYSGSIEAVLLPTIQVLENIIKLNFSNAVKTIFSLKKGTYQLIESESKLEGREVAYIHKLSNLE